SGQRRPGRRPRADRRHRRGAGHTARHRGAAVRAVPAARRPRQQHRGRARIVGCPRLRRGDGRHHHRHRHPGGRAHRRNRPGRTADGRLGMTPQKTRVLVIDDEPQILRALRINLSVRGYEVFTSASGGEALRMAADHRPDVIVLDLGLPDMSGIEVLGGLRGWLTAPVIVLSARTDSSDKVEALDAGADDYVTKPFGMDEFLARLRAAVRRGAAASDTDEPVIETSSFTVDLAAKKVTKNGSEVHLTPTEWGMLEML